MLDRIKLTKLDDYFLSLQKRTVKGVYFYRINGYSEEIKVFLKKYYFVARRTGVVFEGKIPNPDEKNLAYYNEIMGMNFQLSVPFIESSMKKWLPRVKDYQRRSISIAIYDCLMDLQKNGKTENILKNAYIKFMCWLYYRFERILSLLGDNDVPKVIYEGDISNYELMLISILNKAGCDVVLLQHNGDAPYLKADPEGKLSDLYEGSRMEPFPADCILKNIREGIETDLKNQQLYGTPPIMSSCTNAWMKGKGFEDIKTPVFSRGEDTKLIYNSFMRINGVEDKTLYANDLYYLQQDIRSAGRKLVIINGEIPKPEPDEINNIKRDNYTRTDQMIMNLTRSNLSCSNQELQRQLYKVFIDIILEESKKDGDNIHRLTNKAVYLLCWIKRYQTRLFENWKQGEIAAFIHFGPCTNEYEVLYLRFLSKLPVDVLILCPDLNTRCILSDSLLFEINHSESLSINKYPEDNSQMRVGTAAYHAERELDTIMYQDSGLYRTQQYSKANVITLQTMYEEIKLLWDEEVRFRPNFSTNDDVVTIPVIFSKISGVKDGDKMGYWQSIKPLITPDTILIKKPPYISGNAFNPVKQYVTQFYKNNKIQKAFIKNHPANPYMILREDVQDMMLDKLQVLIDQKLIKGIGENGMEYAVVAEIMNLPKDIVRLIQKFDYTKKNPKILYINTSEQVISINDAIVIAYLNLIGFDILFFVPTGYQNVERHFNNITMEEHQIGEYVYDMLVPDFNKLPKPKERQGGRGLFNIFKRGN